MSNFLFGSYYPPSPYNYRSFWSIRNRKTDTTLLLNYGLRLNSSNSAKFYYAWPIECLPDETHLWSSPENFSTFTSDLFKELDGYKL
jgi:hypothetical protein